MPPPEVYLGGRWAREETYRSADTQGHLPGTGDSPVEVKGQESADRMKQRLPAEHSVAAKHPRGLWSSNTSHRTVGAHPPGRLTQHCMTHRRLRQASCTQSLELGRQQALALLGPRTRDSPPRCPGRRC